MTLEISPGSEANVILPPRHRPVRARLHRIEPDGTLTFVEPRCGGLRTVTPEHVTKVHKPKVSRP